MTKNEKALQRRCYHEAGHAVAALALGANGEEITEQQVGGIAIGVDEKAVAINRITIALASLTAERIKYQSGNWLLYATDDYRIARCIAQTAGIEFKGRLFEKRARCILTDRWPQVERIANELITAKKAKQ
jgi:hypothetical protein